MRRRLARTVGALVLFYLVGLSLSALLVTFSAELFGLRFDPAGLTLVELVLQGLFQIIVFGVLSVLLVRVARAAPDTDWRMSFKGGAKGFAVGLGLAALLAAGAMLLAVAFGSAHWAADAGTIGDYVRTVFLTALALAPSALAEELAFRGVPLVLVATFMGRGSAIVFLAVLFALVHWLNPDVTPLGIGNIALAGVFLGLAFYLPGGIWTAWGAHLGWNAMLAALDASVSGLPLRIPLIDFVPGTPAWLTGGRFGPEGGLVATVALAIGSVLLGRRAGKAAAA